MESVSTVGVYLDAVAGVVKRDFRVFVSYRLRFATQILSAFFSVVLFYYVSRLVHVTAFPSHGAYFAFTVVGLAILATLVSTLSHLPGRVRQELVAGTFERFILSPFGPVAGVASLTVFPFLLSLVTGVITIGFAAAAFHMPLRWSTAPLALPAALLGGLAFLPLALLIAAAVILVKQAESGVGFIVSGISLIGGFFFPVTLLPSWIQWVSHVQPFTPTLELLRNVLVGTPMQDSTWLTLLKICLWAVVLLPLATVALARAIQLGQRRGTVIEY